MRSDILAYIKTLSLGTFAVSDELPWDNNGTPLYLTNLKRIYVDADQVAQEALFDTFDCAGPVNEITTVRVYFVTDAKQLPANDDAVVADIKNSRSISAAVDYTQHLCQVSTEFVGDRLVTQFEFSFRKLITN